MDRINPLLGYALTLVVAISIAISSAFLDRHFYSKPKAVQVPLPTSAVKYAHV